MCRPESARTDALHPVLATDRATRRPGDARPQRQKAHGGVPYCVQVGTDFKSRLMARLLCLGALGVDDAVSQLLRGHKLRGGAKGLQFALPVAAFQELLPSQCMRIDFATPCQVSLGGVIS